MTPEQEALLLAASRLLLAHLQFARRISSGIAAGEQNQLQQDIIALEVALKPFPSPAPAPPSAPAPATGVATGAVKGAGA